MSLTELILGLSLSADAFVATLALGVKYHKRLNWFWLLSIPLSFGLFQAVMPLLGWQAMTFFYAWIEAFSAWLACVLLTIIGVNMLRSKNNASPTTPVQSLKQQLTLATLLSLSVATSIDALVIGFTLPSISTRPLFTIGMIGTITAAVCSLGLLAVTKIPNWLRSRAEQVAGIGLILLGLKILVSALLF